MATVTKGHCEPGKMETPAGEARVHTKRFLKQSLKAKQRKLARKK